MNRRVLGGLVGMVAAMASTPAMAHLGAHDLVFPERNDDLATRSATWQLASGWRISPAERPSADGTRVAAIFSVSEARHVPLEARGLGTDASGNCSTRRAGPWTAMEETFTRGELRVAVLDLGQRYACAQIRLRTDDSEIVGDLQWELLEPRHPDAGRASREAAAGVGPVFSVGPELLTIGVITREEWGARPTQCTAVEDNWYRMAIHHTAGPQTANGTVQERLQATQAYAMDSGTWCDIPYQMLVGYDGSLWEGRGVELQSGATGGGNNDGNLAVCFIGCYHQPDSDCVGGVGHDVTGAMMLRGQLLVQTLVRLFDISTSADNIRGHRDWPGNSTACPGSLLHPRLDELRADLVWFSGAEVERSWNGEEIEIPVGESLELWVDLQNTGGLPWVPGQTFLAPTDPRDVESPLHDAGWPSSNRAATVATQVEPGEIGRFVFSVAPKAEQTIVQSFGLVHEGITWFADGPWGGGPADNAVVVTVVATGDDVDDVTSGTGGTGDSDDSVGTSEGEQPDTDGSDTRALPDGYGDDDSGGCGCSSDSRPTAWASAWLLLPLVRRRSRS
jgi:hypothetical protein